MIRTTILCATLLAGGCAHAQAIEPVEQVDTVLYCYNPQEVIPQIEEYGESPLFTGWAIVDTLQGTIAGPMIFAVNQDTGTWAGLIVSPTGLYCSLSVGTDFEPYTERPRERQN